MRGMGETTVPDLGDVYRHEAARLWRAVFAYAQDRAITDDAVAEAFAQCLRRGDAVRDPRAWIWRAAFRMAAGELKARRRFVPTATDVLAPDEMSAADLLSTFAKLPGNQRAAAVLRWYAGFDNAEIAKMLGISRGTVRVHLSRARRRLGTLLDQEAET
jgi:RNA polymerase sigma-70 factor (ECF subfamily)